VPAITVLASGSLLSTEDGTGQSRYSGTVPLKTGDYQKPDGSFGYQLKFGFETRDGRNTVNPDAGGSIAFLDDDNTWGSGAATDPVTPAIDAHFGAWTTARYFSNVHHRTLYLLTQYVHCGDHWNNAVFSPGCYCVGFGDGPGDNPHVSLDVVAHEHTHGVVFETARLGPSGEPDALNEATADIFGAAVEFNARLSTNPGNYLFAEQVEPDQTRRHPADGRPVIEGRHKLLEQRCR
jgi:Zn-dependent metalloprotease